jgi:hypothetical protein
MNVKGALYTLGGVAIAYGGLSLYRQYNLFKKTEFKMVSLKRKAITLQGVSMELVGDITNRTGVDFDVRKQEYAIYLNGKYVGVAGSDKRLLIPKNGGVGRVSIGIFIDFKQFLQAGNTINWAQFASNELGIKGKLKTSTFGLLLSGIPINLNFKIGDFLKSEEA